MFEFSLGAIVMTPSVAVIGPDDMKAALARHAAGDWGDVCASDRKANDRAVKNGNRVLSTYRSDSGIVFWIVTESDRSATTVLLPEDY